MLHTAELYMTGTVSKSDIADFLANAAWAVDQSQKLGKVLLDKNQISSISCYYVEITRNAAGLIFLPQNLPQLLA